MRLHVIVPAYTSHIHVHYADYISINFFWGGGGGGGGNPRGPPPPPLYETLQLKYSYWSCSSREDNSLGPRPKTNPSADCFQYPTLYTGSDIHAGWGLGTRLGRQLSWLSTALSWSLLIYTKVYHNTKQKALFLSLSCKLSHYIVGPVYHSPTLQQLQHYKFYIAETIQYSCTTASCKNIYMNML